MRLCFAVRGVLCVGMIVPLLQLGDNVVVVLAVELVEAHDDENHNGERQRQVQVHALDGAERGGDLRGRGTVVARGAEDERRDAAADKHAELVANALGGIGRTGRLVTGAPMTILNGVAHHGVDERSQQTPADGSDHGRYHLHAETRGRDDADDLADDGDDHAGADDNRRIKLLAQAEGDEAHDGH